MTPLQVTARIAGPIALPERPIALDALLAYAVCLRDGIPPATLASEVQPVEIPVEREPGGRFHLASVGHYEIEQASLKHIHKRAPIEQYQALGSDKIRRVQITAGPNKSYRIPFELLHLVDDSITWWCVGEQGEIEALLQLVHHLGKKRSVGHGKVVRWTIEEMEPWDGFPVAVDGKPLRNLPADWLGLSDPVLAHGNLTYPYWRHDTEEICACPLVAGS